MSTKIRIGSYNIGDFSGDGLVPGTDEAGVAQREVIEEIGAVIWALQEDVEFFGNDGDVYESIYKSYKNYARRGNERYNYKALLSNEEICDVEQIYYSKEIGCRHPWFLSASVKLGGREIRFINVHFDWSDTVVRTKQIAECIEYAYRFENSIIIGDYNPEDCTDGNKNSHLSTYAEDLEAFRAAGFSLANVGEFGVFNTLVHCDMDPCPFDNIAVRGNITIETANIIKKPWMNDHYPIYADIIID